MTEPLPCPFCGEKAELCCNDMGDGYEVDCFSCMARGPGEETAAESVAKWNRASKIVNYTKALCEAHGVPWDA